MNSTNANSSGNANPKSRGRTQRLNRSARRDRFRPHGGRAGYDRSGSAMRRLRRQAETITHDARGLAVTAGTVARQQLDPLKEYVIDKPIQSLLIAAGVGVVFGLVFFRR
jgi:hypothetical protein